MQMHIRKFVLAELERYRDYKSQIEEYELERAEILESYPVATWQKERVSGGNIGDSTANAAARLERLDAGYARARFYVKAIERVLNSLPDENRELIETVCIGGIPAEHAGLLMDRATIYRRLNEILPLFALRMGL